MASNFDSVVSEIFLDGASLEDSKVVLDVLRETMLRTQATEQKKKQEITEAVEAVRVDFDQQYALLDKKVNERLTQVKDGPQGKTGAPGPAGRDGIGKDGKDGKNGVSVKTAKIDFDGSLVITLSDGREINVGEVTGGSSKTFINTAGGGGSIDVSTFVQIAYETVSKNLASVDFTLAYNGSEQLSVLTYTNGILKTLAYNGTGDLITVVLSGSTPAGIELTKTLGYTSGNLTSVTYT